MLFWCILTWWWFGRSEPVCAQRSSVPCRSVPSLWPLPTPPPPSACRLYLWSEHTHHPGRNMSITATRVKSRAEMSHGLRGLTLWDCFEKFGAGNDPILLHLWQTIRFLGFTPEVGAAVHAGYVEDSYALQRHVAEVQGSPATLAKAKQEVGYWGEIPKKVKRTLSEQKKRLLYLLTSTTRQSFSFLQEAKKVSEVANSKYQSLFFILKCRAGNRLFSSTFRGDSPFAPLVRPLTCCWISGGVSLSWNGNDERWRRPVHVDTGVIRVRWPLVCDQKHSGCGSPLQWKSSCWWSHRAPGLLPPEGHLGSPGCSSGPWAPTRLPRCPSGSLSGLCPHNLVGSKQCQEFQFQCPYSGVGTSVVKMLMVSPPPQRRQRARSFPVPSGRTATGGHTCRFSLSVIATVSVRGNWWIIPPNSKTK